MLLISAMCKDLISHMQILQAVFTIWYTYVMASGFDVKQIEKFSVDEFADFLAEKFDEDVVESFRKMELCFC